LEDLRLRMRAKKHAFLYEHACIEAGAEEFHFLISTGQISLQE